MSPILTNLVNIAVWLLLAMCLVLLGWDEPLKYRFISQQQREAEERALFPAPPVSPTPPAPDYRNWSTQKKGSSGSSLHTNGLNATPWRRR